MNIRHDSNIHAAGSRKRIGSKATIQRNTFCFITTLIPEITYKYKKQFYTDCQLRHIQVR